MMSIAFSYEVYPEEECLYPGGPDNINAKVFLSGQEIGGIGGVQVMNRDKFIS
jgi:hypothetical protein